jgi:hypothetical protein
VRKLAIIAAAFAVFAAGVTTDTISASARMRGGDGEHHHFGQHRNFGGGFNYFSFGFGSGPYFAPYYEPYYQPHYVSRSCWRWTHRRHHKHHRVWVCGPRHY